LGSSSSVEIVELFVDNNNRYFYNEQEYSELEMNQLLSEKINASDNKSVKIYADKKSDFQAVISLIQLLKDNNFDKISFVVRKTNN